jgi:hypothetical protein
VFLGRDERTFLENQDFLTRFGQLGCDDCASRTRAHDNNVHTHLKVSLLQRAFDDSIAFQAREF